MSDSLKQLAAISLTNKVENLFVKQTPKRKLKPVDLNDLVSKSQIKLKKQLNVTPRLTGSIPLNLNLPHDTDLDYFIPVKSQTKFKKIIKRLNKHPDYMPSPYNLDGTNYHVFTRKSTSHQPVPVDVAVATGPASEAYLKALRNSTKASAKIDPKTREALRHKKHILKHTPFDYKQKRYKAWKRDLDKALGNSVRLKREPLDKTAAVLDMSDPQEQRKLLSYLERDDVYGHRTPHLESIIEEQRLYSALEALKRGKLKSYEQGASVGTHADVTSQRLSDADVKMLEMELLKDTPSTAIVQSMADKYKVDENTIKREFIKTRYPQIKRWLTQQKDPENIRQDRLSVPKLGPNIFASKGGLLDTPGYGNYGVLFRSRKAMPSPFLNIINREHIIPQKGIMSPRSVKLRNNYVIAPHAEIQTLDKRNPKLRYIDAEQIPDNIREKLYMPTRSLNELYERVIPHALKGDLHVRQTR